jgi:hypothetical protein
MVSNPSSGTTPVVIVHGVGDQKLGQTARQVACIIGKSLCENQGVVALTEGISIICSPSMSDEGGLSPSFTVVGEGDIPSQKATFYDFHWAYLSRATDTDSNRFIGLAKTLISFASFGRFALQESPRGSLYTQFSSVLLTASCWLLALRTIAIIVLEWKRVLNPNDLLFFVDVALSILLLLFLLALVAHWIAGLSRYSVATAMLVLTVGVLTWGVIPGAARRTTEHAASSRNSSLSSTEPRILSFEADVNGSTREITTDWFYAYNTLSGLVFLFGLTLAAVWLIWASVRFIRIWRQQLTDVAKAKAAIDELQRKSFWIWMIIATILLFLNPSLMLFDTGWILATKTLPPTYLPSDSPLTELAEWWGSGILAVSGIVAAALFIWSPLRPLCDPLLELCLDVTSYFRARGKSGQMLADQVQRNLDNLLKNVQEIHKTPAVVVAHSLGSVIALQTIARGAPSAAVITLGSPLALLHRRMPSQVRQWLNDLNANNATVIWHNWYLACDVVGRDLESIAAGRIQDLMLGPGGHTDYFACPEFADRLSVVLEQCNERLQ